MKRILCALLAALLAAGCALPAIAEEAEIIPLEEGAVVESTVAPEETPATDVAEPEEGAVEEDAPEPATQAPAATPAPNTVRIGFEDGFALHLPEGWLFHPTSAEMAEQGVVYCLSDAEGAGWLYIQCWETDCADLDALKELIDRTTDIQTSGVYSFNGTDFVVYDLTEGDVSCCAALADGKVINLVFTPQSDADFMAIAVQILNTFELL